MSGQKIIDGLNDALEHARMTQPTKDPREQVERLRVLGDQLFWGQPFSGNMVAEAADTIEALIAERDVPIEDADAKRRQFLRDVDQMHDLANRAESALKTAVRNFAALEREARMREALEKIAGGFIDSAADLAIGGNWREFTTRLQLIAKTTLPLKETDNG